MTFGKGFVKCAKCLLVVVWHIEAMLDGSAWLGAVIYYVNFKLKLPTVSFLTAISLPVHC